MRARVVEIFDPEDATFQMKRIGVDPRGIQIMAPKLVIRCLKLEGVKATCGNILKQEMLSCGGEAALARGAITGGVKRTDCILSGTLAQFNRLCEKLDGQPLGLPQFARDIRKVLSDYAREEFELRCGHFLLNLGRRTYVMGVLNLTPDSFSGDGIYKNLARATDRAQRMAEDGADIIDVGGESTRPGAKPVSVKEELARVLPAVERLAKVLKVPISIDTSRSKVARACLDLGASIVNDIRGLRADPGLAKLAASYGAAVVIMHIKGRPRTMQANPTYTSLISEIIASLRKSIQIAHRSGVGDDKIIVDPGIGFGKTTDHNLEILGRLREFKSLGHPILVGTSRKSVIGGVLGLPVDQRGWGTAATVALAVANGTHIVRVHEVKEMVQVVRMSDAITK